MIAFRLLGPLEVEVEGRPVRVVGKPAALLVALLLRRNEAVPGERLLDELWDELPQTGRKVLQVNVSQLRKLLGAERIRTVGPGYVLDATEQEVDLWRFERLLAEAQRARADDPPHARALLDDALALWRGAPLADLLDEPIAAAAAARIDDLHLLALEERADAALELGEHTALLSELERLVAEHPLRERLRGLLMVALYRAGRQADALARYRDGRDVLAESLGLDPAPSLRRLHEAILRQSPELDAPAPAPRSSLLLGGADEGALALLAPLARTSGRELVLAQPVRDAARLGAATGSLARTRQRLSAEGIATRVAAFTSTSPLDDLARLSERPEVELLALALSAERLRALASVAPLLEHAACDVALLVRESPAPGGGPVVVPFGASDNDWAALELGVALARAHDTELILAGGTRNGADASRTLAAASLAVQRVADLVARPLVLSDDAALREAAAGATALVLGVPDDWRSRGLGPARERLVADPVAPTLLVHRGVRAGVLAPEAPVTRFTWSR